MEFQMLIMECRRLEDLYRDAQHAGKVVAGLEALDDENTRLTEKHRELQAATEALQGAHDQKLAALEHEYATVHQTRMAHAGALEAAHAKKLAALEAEFTATQEARITQASAHEAALQAALLIWQERAERARAQATTVETHLANTQQAHTQAMQAMRAEAETLQAEVTTLTQQVAERKEEMRKHIQHLRSLVTRELA